MAAAFNQMLRSLRELASAAQRIGEGDLTVRLDMEGQLAQAFIKIGCTFVANCPRASSVKSIGTLASVSGASGPTLAGAGWTAIGS